MPGLNAADGGMARDPFADQGPVQYWEYLLDAIAIVCALLLAWFSLHVLDIIPEAPWPLQFYDPLRHGEARIFIYVVSAIAVLELASTRVILKRGRRNQDGSLAEKQPSRGLAKGISAVFNIFLVGMLVYHLSAIQP